MNRTEHFCLSVKQLPNLKMRRLPNGTSFRPNYIIVRKCIVLVFFYNCYKWMWLLTHAFHYFYVLLLTSFICRRIPQRRIQTLLTILLAYPNTPYTHKRQMVFDGKSSITQFSRLQLNWNIVEVHCHPRPRTRFQSTCSHLILMVFDQFDVIKVKRK